MTAIIIDGKSIAAALREQITLKVTKMASKPCLAVILIGNDPASHVYIRNKLKATHEVGILSIEHRLPENANDQDITILIDTLNADQSVHGILLQLPLPRHLNADTLIQRIAPTKDVDGLTITNIGKLVAGIDGLVPCTPQAALKLIKSIRQDLSGLHAVVIGRSLLFGKPMAQLLLAQHCTVTTAHSKSKNLSDICKTADILIAAVGKAEIVKADFIKPGAIVIDVGINRMPDGTLKGDVDYEAARKIAYAISPVPGGVGPMTIACLLANTLKATQTKL
jgi:methylenetetrahydrofolate dehydrogenase (NADP+) / methenyltetrahydrofolate cyclohydrolase